MDEVTGQQVGVDCVTQTPQVSEMGKGYAV